MNSDRFLKLREIVDAALELPSAEREELVRLRCDGDAALVTEVLGLLAHEGTAGHDLTSALDDQVRRAATQALGGDDLPGDIGDFRIVEKIGEGGMGVVYRAEQTGALERPVALKLIRAGWNSQRVVARFESERLALARMDHRNIARVFDAGSTEDGRPWFAMELVEGRPLTAWCDENRLDTRARLELFLAVCRGVQHAHQKGIIHRDLKPSNVLVTAPDGRPEPKIIDFGIAKALTGPEDDAADLTISGQRLGSPDYMSPERIEGLDDDADIRTDVYSLGVLLYELLSGRLPFDRASRRGLVAGTGVGTGIEPPSLAAKPTGSAHCTREIAQVRRTDPRALRRLLQGELEWVVAKALAPKRDDRYATARGLMLEVERYLKGEPVEAGRPGVAYRLGKFVRRHRVAITVTGAVIVGLAGGLAESQRQRLLADSARDEAETVTAFLSNMLASVEPDEQGRDVTVRQVLDLAGGAVGEDFADRPLVRARLQSTIGLAYIALGENEAAISQQEQSLSIRRRELGDGDPLTLDSMCDLGQALSRAGRFAEAGELYREALAAFRRSSGDQVEKICQAMNGLANAVSDQGRLDEAEPYYLEALAAAENRLDPTGSMVCSLLNNLALLRADQGRMEEAAEMLEQVLVYRRERLGEDHTKTMESVISLAGARSLLGDYAASIHALEPLVPRARRIVGEKHRITLAAMNNLAWCYARNSQLSEAAALTLETLEIRRRDLGEEHPETLISAHNMADIHRRSGRLAEAEALHRETLATRRRVLGEDHFHTRYSLSGLAEVLQDQGREEEAAVLRTEAEGAP